MKAIKSIRVFFLVVVAFSMLFAEDKLDLAFDQAIVSDNAALCKLRSALIGKSEEVNSLYEKKDSEKDLIKLKGKDLQMMKSKLILIGIHILLNQSEIC